MIDLLIRLLAADDPVAAVISDLPADPQEAAAVLWQRLVDLKVNGILSSAVAAAGEVLRHPALGPAVKDQLVHLVGLVVTDTALERVGVAA